MRTAPPDNGLEAGPGVDVWASFRMRLESASAAMEEHYRKYQRLWATLHQVQLTGPPLDTTASPPVVHVDRPDLLGPHTGYWWDIRRLTFAPSANASPWTGTIYVYNSLIAATNLVDIFTNPEETAGDITHYYGKAHLLLSNQERLVYVASADFAGQAELGGRALLITDDCVPVYLT